MLRYIGDYRRFVLWNTTKFERFVLDSILHNSTKAIVKATLEVAGTANTKPLSRKAARLPQNNVDVEPSSSMDDSPMIDQS